MRRIVAGLLNMTVVLVMAVGGASAASGATRPASSSGAASSAGPGPGQEFFTPPARVRGVPGTVLKHEASTFYLDPAKLLRASARVQRLMYVSTGPRGEPTAVTGTLMTPTAKWAGRGSRPLVSYALGTVGMADRCAPSRQMADGTLLEGAMIQTLLSRGYAVVATDYQGLGTPGTHTYLDARVLGRNVLDAARAAKRTPVDRVPSDARVMVAGYSEGGTSAAGALEQQPTYAPAIKLIGGYVGAPAVSLTSLAQYIDGGPYTVFVVEAMAGLADNYPELRINALLNDAGKQALATARTTCVVDGAFQFGLHRTSEYTKSGESFTQVMSRSDIARVVRTMSLGHRKPGAPLIATHSVVDDIVPMAPHRATARAWCRLGAKVTFQTVVVPTHILAMVGSSLTGFAYLADRIDDVAPRSNCGQF